MKKSNRDITTRILHTENLLAGFQIECNQAMVNKWKRELDLALRCKTCDFRYTGCKPDCEAL